MRVVIQDRLRKISKGHIALALALVLFAGSLGLAQWRAHVAAANAAAGSVQNPTPQDGKTGTNAVAVLQARIAANPGDVSLWRQLGEAQFEADHFDEAVRAYEQAAQRQPGLAAIWSAMGEARVMASAKDPMPAAATQDFRRALALDPKDARARYFLAVARDLSGDHAGAISDWLALLADTPPGASWEANLRLTIAQVGKINHIAVTSRLAEVKQPVPVLPAPQPDSIPTPGLPGPSADQLRAAASIPPSQQQQMAKAMVERLATRLHDQPANPEGWIMLIRSRMNLGQPDLARAALAEALRANPAQADQLRGQAAQLGLR